MRRIALALSFLTRLPCHPEHATEEDVGRSLAWFPAVGALLGGVLVAVQALLAAELSAPVVAVAMVALLAAATGGIHLDGLADVFDALGATGADRERMLVILRDSRIGAHGATALVLVLIAKSALLAEVLADDRPVLLVAFPAVGRLAAVLDVVLFRYAREHGLGAVFRAHVRGGDVALAAATTLVVVLGAGGAAVVAAVLALAAGLLFARMLARRLGGLTGDAYGATIELVEVLFLSCALATS